jgi:hypothetical protein
MARTDKAVQEINELQTPDAMASWVVGRYVEWRGAQMTWLDESKELRDYLFQTDTTQTSNAQLPWKNKTSVPKLTQLRDNLYANYMAALFPNDNWFRWEAGSQDAAVRDTAVKIESYMRQKIKESDFKKIIGRCVYDYIDYGNSFAEVSYVSQQHVGPDGEPVAIYAGPKVYRLSPYDLYFDLSASSFKEAAKITRRLVSFGTLQAAFNEDPSGFSWVPDALKKVQALRSSLSAYGDSDIDKSEGFQKDGLGDLSRYYSSDMIELLEFEGDVYNREKEELKLGRRMIVVDRKWMVHDDQVDSWLGRSNKEHVAWRERPDSLLGAGPLDNLVGMQYRLDHLENLKADVFDMIAHPIVVVKGTVEDFEWGPGERIFTDLDSDVQPLRPDTTALNADFQMDRLMGMMEELAGAPKQAMGIRTPGEKTAFEVQALENNAGRIFQQKITKFEEEFVEPLLNQMLESARRNIAPVEVVKVLSDDFAVQQFLTITKEDLNQKGKLYPTGARHFAASAQIVQNLMGFVNSAAYQDPGVQAHVSGIKLAELMEEHLGLERFELVGENIRVAEQQQTQSNSAMAQENVMTEVAERQGAEDMAQAEEEQDMQEALNV